MILYNILLVFCVSNSRISLFLSPCVSAAVVHGEYSKDLCKPNGKGIGKNRTIPNKCRHQKDKYVQRIWGLFSSSIQDGRIAYATHKRPILENALRIAAQPLHYRSVTRPIMINIRAHLVPITCMRTHECLCNKSPVNTNFLPRASYLFYVWLLSKRRWLSKIDRGWYVQ